MKKIEKILLATAGILFALGLALVIGGAIFGGVRDIGQYISEGLEKLNIQFPNISGVNSKFDFDLAEYPATSGEVNCSYSLDEINGVVIRVKAGDVDVRTSADDFVVSGDGLNIRTFDREGILYVAADAMDGCIQIPNTHLDKMEIEAGGGDINVATSAVIDNFSLSAGLGDVKLSGIVGENVALSVGAGDLELNNIEADNIAVAAGAGDINITLAGALEDYNYDLAMKVGELYLNGTRYEGSLKRADASAQKNLTISGSAGSVELNFE